MSLSINIGQQGKYYLRNGIFQGQKRKFYVGLHIFYLKQGKFCLKFKLLSELFLPWGR